jgi:hypothetical protein
LPFRQPVKNMAAKNILFKWPNKDLPPFPLSEANYVPFKIIFVGWWNGISPHNFANLVEKVSE